MKRENKSYQIIVRPNKEGKFEQETKLSAELVATAKANGRELVNQKFFVCELLIEKQKDSKGRTMLGGQGRTQTVTIFERNRPLEFEAIKEALTKPENYTKFGDKVILETVVLNAAVIPVDLKAEGHDIQFYQMEKNATTGKMQKRINTVKHTAPDGTITFAAEEAISESLTIVVFEDENESVVLKREIAGLCLVPKTAVNAEGK